MIAGSRQRRVRTGGVELCVAELGDAARPTVVLVHGYPDSKVVWSRVAPRLAERFHVVLYDVRGCGDSTAPRPLRGGFTLEKLTDDFLAVIDAVSPDRPVHLVGHDWGSVQGWEFTTIRRTEGRIASFTSMSGPSLDHLGHWMNRRVRRPTPRRLAQALGQGFRSWYVYALHTPVLPEAAWRGPLGKSWPALMARAEKAPRKVPGRTSGGASGGASGGKRDDGFWDGYPSASLREDAAHGAWLYRDNVRPRMARPRADAYAHAPVQLITPARDPYLSERLYDDLDQWAPRLVRRTLDAGHWLPRTRPDQLAAWIDEFATSVESTGSAGSAGSAGSVGSAGSAGSVEEGGPVREAAPAAPYSDRFGGRLVLVTGAASGIGRATALAFAEAGARVVAVDQDDRGAATTARTARLAGAREAWAETADVSDEEAMDKLARRVAAEYGVVDVLVNSAGVAVTGAFLDTSTDDWRRVLDTNLWGVIHSCRLFGGQMAERGQGGHIVNIASAAAFQPSRLLPAYGASKAAVLMLSESLRAELARRDIGVSAICPGFVATGIIANTRFAGTTDEEQRRRRTRSAKLLRMRGYPPEKVAAAILRAVARNEPVVALTAEGRTARLLSRVSPKSRRAIARIDPGV